MDRTVGRYFEFTDKNGGQRGVMVRNEPVTYWYRWIWVDELEDVEIRRAATPLEGLELRRAGWNRITLRDLQSYVAKSNKMTRKRGVTIKMRDVMYGPEYGADRRG